MFKISCHQRGWYIIEVAIAILGVGAFAVAASDVTRFYQGKSAVRAAVQEGLRCLYPTDTNCSAVLPGTVVPGGNDELYDVTVTTPGDRQYEVDMEALSASAQWLTAPVLEVPKEVTKVTAVTVIHGAHRYVNKQLKFPVQMGLPYLMETHSMPQVVGTDLLNPEFHFPGTDRAMKPVVEGSITGMVGATTRGPGNTTSEAVPLGAFKFSTGDALPDRYAALKNIAAIKREYGLDVRCYRGPTTSKNFIHWGSPSVPKECFYRGEEDPLLKQGQFKIPIMLHISGSVINAEPGSRGKVLISLEWGGQTYRLGGRVLDPGGSGSFVVRGASYEDMSVAARIAHSSRYPQEIANYGKLPLIPVGEEVQIRFHLASTNGKRIGWRGGNVRVYYSKFRFKQEIFDCGFSAEPHRCEAYPRGVPRGAAYLRLHPDRAIRAETVGAPVCQRSTPGNFEQDPEGRLLRIRERLEKGQTVTTRSFVVREKVAVSGQGCLPETAMYPCNLALSGATMKGCGVAVTDPPSSNVLEACSVPSVDSELDRAVSVQSTLVPTGEVQRIKPCTQGELPACAKPHAREVARDLFVKTASIPESQCPHVQRHQPSPVVDDKVYDACVESDNLSSRARELEQTYRTNHQVPEGIPVSIARRTVGTRKQSAQPVCSRYTERASQVGEVKTYTGVHRDEVDNLCPPGTTCVWTRTANSSTGSTGAAADYQLRMEGAIERAVQTAQGAFPSAQYRSSCDRNSSEGCLEVSGKVADEASLTARMVVSLRLLKAFGSSGVTVEHSARRKPEQSMIW